MIDRIKGILIDSYVDSVVIETTSGLAYKVLVSLFTSKELMGSKNKEVTLYTYLRVKEDDLTLFGFLNEKERDMFLNLIKVNGVGPKQAMKILSGVSISDLISALNRADVGFLKKIPGLGAKTSSKIILELKDKLAIEDDGESIPTSKKSNEYKDLVESLVAMGFDKKSLKANLERILSEESVKLNDMTESKREQYLFVSLMGESKW